jgi:uncharacterized membrane protein
MLYCSTTGIINCSSVLNSSYSHVFGVPISLLGLVWALFGFYAFLRAKNRDLSFLWSLAGAFGVIYSFASMTMLQEICEYCLALDILIIAALFLVYKTGKQARIP